MYATRGTRQRNTNRNFFSYSNNWAILWRFSSDLDLSGKPAQTQNTTDPLLYIYNQRNTNQNSITQKYQYVLFLSLSLSIYHVLYHRSTVSSSDYEGSKMKRATCVSVSTIPTISFDSTVLLHCLHFTSYMYLSTTSQPIFSTSTLYYPSLSFQILDLILLPLQFSQGSEVKPSTCVAVSTTPRPSLQLHS